MSVLAAVVDTKNVLGKVRHHSEESRQPHPEHGTGTTRSDGSGYTGDIADSDCGCKRST